MIAFKRENHCSIKTGHPASLFKKNTCYLQQAAKYTFFSAINNIRKQRNKKKIWWLIKWATIQGFYTFFLNAIYVSEYIILFIYLTKNCVCARRSLNGCEAEWPSQWSFSNIFHVGVTDFWKRQEPFLLPPLSSAFQPITAEITSEVMGDGRNHKNNYMKQNENVSSLEFKRGS